MDNEYKIINSPLSQKIVRDGTTIDVLIYRGEHEAAWILEVILIYRGENDRAWVLEVVVPGGAATVWEDNFATEQDALNEVYQTIASEGIGSFLREPDQKLH